MKLSLDWLGEFVTWRERDPAAIARTVTAHIAEVEEVISRGALLERCCIGKVLSVNRHPNADKLVLCDVQTDQGIKRVVCGGTNLRPGMRVAFAHAGARVRWHGTEMMTLAKTKIRGEESEGMICAADELDLAERFPQATGHQIIDLGDGDDGVGKPLREYLGLTDTVLDIDNHAITHRPDLFSHIGFARELVAVGLAKWKTPPASGKRKQPLFAFPRFPKTPLPFAIRNDAGNLIPRYCACTLSIDAVGETPDWMRRRLEATGWRSLSLPIDITNYVAMELGMPLHSFDVDDLRGTVHMRESVAGEKVVTLDGVSRPLPQGAIILSDDEGIFDLLGIMGGERSSTKQSTRRILLHSAIVDPVAIRNAIIATGHRTDAATVYEKGIPPVMAAWGFARALELFLRFVPGAAITSRMESWGKDSTSRPISFPLARARSVLGAAIPTPVIRRILTDLGCAVQVKGKAWSVTPPPWRAGDLKAEHDLTEEIGRIYGYDRIAPAMPAASIAPPARDVRLVQMRTALAEDGGTELVPLSLLGPEMLRQCAIDPTHAVQIDNALGEELSLLQPTLLPALLANARENLRHVERALKTFAVSHVFPQNGERLELGLLVAARGKTGIKDDPFLEAKAAASAALSAAGYASDFRPAKMHAPYAHPGRTADILVESECIGQIFEVQPFVREQFDLPYRASAALLHLDALFTKVPHVRLAPKISAFPAVVYDVTVPLDADKPAEELRKRMFGRSTLLRGIDIVDLYSAGTSSEYSVTFRLTYQSDERTLTESEVKLEHEKVCAVLS